MTELMIRPDEIRDALDGFVKSYEPGAASRDEVGVVTEAGDGIARVEGLPSVMASELLRFADGTLGLALNLDVREIGVVVLGEFSGIEEGQEVTRTGEILSVPVGDAFLGRVVDPLGTPIDGLGDIASTERRALETQAATVVQRKSVHEPLQTGIKAIDAMTPIGPRQRRADHRRPPGTGKDGHRDRHDHQPEASWPPATRPSQVRGIYWRSVQKGSPIAAVRGALEEAGAWSTPPSWPLRRPDRQGSSYLAPTTGLRARAATGCTTASTSSSCSTTSASRPRPTAPGVAAAAPPAGREAYPGDVFYLHSRCSSAAQLSTSWRPVR
jgi:F-type H+-transporting ATPase subunit alpha